MEHFEEIFGEYERGRETEQPEPSRQSTRRARSRSVAPQTEFLGETLRDINRTLENINENILINRLQPQQPQQPMQTLQLPQKNLSMNFEQYQNYLGRISTVNNYIYEQFSNGDIIDINSFKFIEEVEPGFKERNSDLFNLIEEYNNAAYEYQSTFDMSGLLDYIIELTNTIITPLPNIDPEIRRKETLKKIPTLPGTDNVLFTKIKSDKKTSYDSVIGDYTRLDIPKAEPCKLRYNSKDPQNPFQVTQGSKKFVFNNLNMAKTFCLNGGVQADFIGAKNQIDYDRKYKNQYYQTAVLR